MVIGVPRETKRHEHRVGLSPFAVSRLVQQGHLVFIENRAGETAHFHNSDYENAGGRIVYAADEIYQRADLVCRVGILGEEEIELLRSGSTICAFHHLAVAPRRLIDRLSELESSLIGYEIIQDHRGSPAVLVPFSEMGGQMAIHVATYYLQNETGGRGVLMGNVPGVPPPTVVIVGAGRVGESAARQALACGAHAIVLDSDLHKLDLLNRALDGRAATVLAARERLEQYSAIADILIGAVLIPEERSPFLITESMVKAMKPGSVIVDVAIDQGGCVETSRPTSIADPVFVAHGVLHYCVPNMTANVARTASRVLVNAALPYISEIAGKGLDVALRENSGLAAGVFMYRGRLVSARAAHALGIASTPLSELLEEGQR